MAETILVEEMEETKGYLNTVADVAHKAFQASLGAVAMAQSEAAALLEKAQKEATNRYEKTQKNTSKMVNKLVARGADIEHDGRERANEMIKARRKQVKESVSGAQESLDGRIEAVLHRMNVPSKSDIDALNRKLTTLTKKVNTLSKEQN